MDGKKIENLLENKLTVAGKVKIVTCGHMMSLLSHLVNCVGETMCLQNDIKETYLDN